METVRKARIVSAQKKGVSTDLSGTIDGNPDRVQYVIEAINCTRLEFIDWFLETESGDDFCSDGTSLIDIGGSMLDMSPGNILEVTFSSWFESRLENNIASAKCELNKLAWDTIQRLQA